MIANIEDFLKYVPTAAEGVEFEDIATFILEGEEWLKTEIYGEAVYDLIEGKEDSGVKILQDRFVALKAYETAIPFLDLIQTQSGFGVIASANLLPASAERVERLIQSVSVRMYNTLDTLIDTLRMDEELREKWTEHPRFEYLTELLFWTGRELKQYGGDFEQVEVSGGVKLSYKSATSVKEHAKRKATPWLDLQRLHSVLKGYQDTVIADYLSKEYVNEIVSKMRENTPTPFLQDLKSVLGLLLQKEDLAAASILSRCVNYMDMNLEDFPIYALSQTYKMKTIERYENKQEDATFFF